MSIERYGHYELIKRLATGGMAQIYLARERAEDGSEKLVVLKRILSHLAENEEFVRMFLDEARIAARLNHPNIVQIFNLGAQDDSYFIAMEYIHGEDVRRVWKQANRLDRTLPPSLVAKIIADACAGLDYAHKKADAQGKPLNIVHRDISPQNILVTFSGAVKVVDFGIAKAADQATVTRSGVLKGKYSYMSPEQSAGKKLDCRSDTFALGVVLWELLTGARLFKKSNDIQTLTAVAECKVPPPSTLVPSLPPELDAIVLKALAKSPDARYQEAGELRAALEKWAAKQQPAPTSASLGAFMQELYAERLEAERKEGRVLVEDFVDEGGKSPRPRSKASAGPTPAPVRPSLPEAQRPTSTARLEKLAIRPEGSRKSDAGVKKSDGLGLKVPPVEERKSDGLGVRPHSSGEASARRSVGEPSPKKSDAQGVRAVSTPPRSDPPSDLAATALAAPTISEPAGFSMTDTENPGHSARSLSPERKAQIALIGIVVAVILGFSAAMIFVSRRQQPTPLVTSVPASELPARVRIVSDPPGASVTFKGLRVADATPCVLPASKAGTYPLVLNKPGFLEYRTSISIPSSGQAAFPIIRLQRELETPNPRVTLAFESDPPGAVLSLDGNAVGKTPHTLEARVGEELSIKLEHPGYYSLLRQFKVTPQLPSVLRLKLERHKDSPRGRPTGAVQAGSKSGRTRAPP